MRVIAGSARGIPLLPVKSYKTRPILDRVKESLFSILANSVVDSNIIDLFAGTGGLGIEALSRGAKSCVFVDDNLEAIQAIKKNLEKTSLLYRSKMIKTDVFTLDSSRQFETFRECTRTGTYNNGLANYTINGDKEDNAGKVMKAPSEVKLLSDRKIDLMQFGVILVGAPYPFVEKLDTRESLFKLFKRFVEKQIVLSDGIIVLQHKKEKLRIEKEIYKVEIYDSRTYGKTQISFMKPFVEL